MNDAAPRRAGRPGEPILSREIITRTALQSLSHGADGSWGMRHIARKLGVRPSALYNHVASQEDLIGAVRELISDRIDVSGFDRLPWYDALSLWARSYRDAFAEHPRTVALLALHPLRGAERTLRMYDAVCAGLLAADWPPGRVLPVVVSVENFCLGAALDRAAPHDMMDPGGDRQSALGLAYRMQAEATTEGSAADQAFKLGLRALISGLRAEHTRHTKTREQ